MKSTYKVHQGSLSALYSQKYENKHPSYIESTENLRLKKMIKERDSVL